MQCRKTLLVASLCAVAWGQTGLTTIQDTLFKADGTRFNGSLIIHWSTFDASNATTIIQQSRTVPVVNGNLLVQLTPNADQPVPANTYIVQYQSDGHEQFSEIWSVPVSASPLRISQVRTGVLSGSGGSTGGGGTGNTAPIAESAVIGLQADLSQRPVKGSGFGTNRVAVVNDSGQIETAVGNTSDCVLVDGTAGPCVITFADAETPGGLVDGSNDTFTLAATPQGGSLQLFRNGLYMTSGFDYTLTASSIQFVSNAIPRPGDQLTANYRVDTSSIGSITNGGPAIRTASAQVLCSAAGTANNTAAVATLGSCTIPAGGLYPGDRIELRFTVLHTGGAAGFEVQALWGNAPFLVRNGGAQDTAFAARAEAALSAGGAELSVESWGTSLPFQTAIVAATQQAPVVVTIKARLANAVSSDSVRLANYTVLRYPGN